MARERDAGGDVVVVVVASVGDRARWPRVLEIVRARRGRQVRTVGATVAFYDPADPVRSAQIVERYRFHDQGRLVEDEGMRCHACGFNSRKPGTPVFAWVRTREETERATIELCEVCNAAAGGPPTL